jgi:hypothetical protein
MDPNARVVDQCEDVTRLDFWRSTMTSTASRLRAAATSTVAVSSWLGDDTRANGYAEVSVSTFSVATSEVGVALRILSATQHYVCGTTQAGKCDIWQYNSAFSSLATVTITLPAVPFTLGADIVDSTIRMWINGSIVLVTNGATLFSGPGKFGPYLFAVTSVANVEVDRWEAGPGQGPRGLWLPAGMR